MKIRQGFVSNSSSSSFVISYKSVLTKAELKTKYEEFINQYIEERDITNHELIQYEETFKRFEKAHKNGRELKLISVENGCFETVEQIFNITGVIIEEDLN